MTQAISFLLVVAYFDEARPQSPPEARKSSCAPMCGALGPARPKSSQGWLCLPPAGSFGNNKPTTTESLSINAGEGSPRGHLCPSCGDPQWLLPPLRILGNCPHYTHTFTDTRQMCAHTQVQTRIFARKITTTPGVCQCSRSHFDFHGPRSPLKKINKNYIL